MLVATRRRSRLEERDGSFVLLVFQSLPWFEEFSTGSHVWRRDKSFVLLVLQRLPWFEERDGSFVLLDLQRYPCLEGRQVLCSVSSPEVPMAGGETSPLFC